MCIIYLGYHLLLFLSVIFIIFAITFNLSFLLYSDLYIYL